MQVASWSRLVLVLILIGCEGGATLSRPITERGENFRLLCYSTAILSKERGNSDFYLYGPRRILQIKFIIEVSVKRSLHVEKIYCKKLIARAIQGLSINITTSKADPWRETLSAIVTYSHENKKFYFYSIPVSFLFHLVINVSTKNVLEILETE